MEIEPYKEIAAKCPEPVNARIIPAREAARKMHRADRLQRARVSCLRRF
ncbi:MAG TPA: hypothetical protein H9852_03915 [Candidatus Mediterraneibacter colneyensis]|nr:hypothetical protein [Candidatus Mediterraneibacter colneyensis]